MAFKAAGDGDRLIKMTPCIPYSRSPPRHPCLRRHPNCQRNWYSCVVFRLRWEWNPDECFLWNTQRDMHFSWARVCSVPWIFSDCGCLCEHVCGGVKKGSSWCVCVCLWEGKRAVNASACVRACRMYLCVCGCEWMVKRGRARERESWNRAREHKTHSNWHSSHLCSRNNEVKCWWDSDPL